MWTRKQLKEKAKITFKRNYWRCVLIALLFGVVTIGGQSISATSFGGGSDDSGSGLAAFQESSNFGDMFSGDGLLMKLEGQDDISGLMQTWANSGASDEMTVAAVIILILVVTIVVLVVLALMIVLETFVLNPVKLGCDRFFFRNLAEPAQIREVAYGFDHGYKNIVKIMFFRDMYAFLWGLLFVIPGIVKSYEYQMIPYLLAENPDMTKEEAFAESRRMMTGQKWRAFVLDLSFIGWKILSACTFGILDTFYVAPYINATYAALYESLRYGNQAPQEAPQTEG